MRYENLLGKKFGDLTPIEQVGRDKTGCVLWKCTCSCGNEVIKSSKNLKRGKPNCGCKTSARLSENNKTHGLTNTRLYRILNGMKNRCYNKKSKDYKNYGKRGIIICDEWMDKENGCVNFYNWAINNGYEENLSIDRIDVNGNYEPSNCRWVDLTTQLNNTRVNHYVTINGETKTVTEWARLNGINPFTADSRIVKQGWNPVDAVTIQAKDQNKYITYNNETHSLKEWSIILNIPKKTLAYRLRHWNDIEKSFTTPLANNSKSINKNN